MRIRLWAPLGLAAALLSLTACQSSPDAAAYVGGTTISEARVTELLDGYNKTVPAEQQLPRVLVVQYLVHDELCQRLAKQKGFTVPEVPQAPSDTPEFAVIANRTEACVNAIPLPDQLPTDEEFRDLYERATAAGLIPADAGFNAVLQLWRGDEQLISLLSRERALQDASSDVRVNPRYGSLSIVGINPAVARKIGDRTGGVVVDRPVPASAAPQE